MERLNRIARQSGQRSTAVSAGASDNSTPATFSCTARCDTSSGMTDTDHERAGLIAITALIVVALVTVAIAVMRYKLTPEAGTVLGLIVGGLLAIGKDTLSALRTYSTSAQLSKVTDQLAASSPGSSAPQDAKDAARQTADAADARAEEIAGG